jgi:hypothetical protein
MGNLFVSDGTQLISLDHMAAARLRGGVLEMGTGNGGIARFNVEGYPADYNVVQMFADCADEALVSGPVASELPSFSDG